MYDDNSLQIEIWPWRKEEIRDRFPKRNDCWLCVGSCNVGASRVGETRWKVKHLNGRRFSRYIPNMPNPVRPTLNTWQALSYAS